MNTITENLNNRILDCLNIQEPLRCSELTMLFGRCSIRELQSVFPTLIRSIFGIDENNENGWGLRTTLRNSISLIYYDTLFGFFAPNGPMLKLCYRLVQESCKFEVNLNLLPHRFLEMLQSRNCPLFYTDSLQIDQYTRELTSLVVNAFDYFMLHFVLHGLLPLHMKYSVAEQVHNDCSKTVYFALALEYFGTFLPSNVDAIIPPNDLCLVVKSTQPLPAPTMQPHRSPKYLKIPSGTIYNDNTTLLNVSTSNTPSNYNNQTSRMSSFSGDLVRSNTWRTESVLHLFVDISLHEDIDNVLHLPSSEFVRVIHMLIKHIHAFGYGAPKDNTTLATLRYNAQPLLRSRIYPFLRSIIARWPLDSSIYIVLELWYSYIQPWRYENLSIHSDKAMLKLPRDGRYDSFITDNLFIYTQIFVLLLPRFERLDFSIPKNCELLQKFVRILYVSIGTNVLQTAEQRYLNSSISFDTSPKHSR